VLVTRPELTGRPFHKVQQFVLPVPVLVVVMAGKDGVVMSPVVMSVVDSDDTVVGVGLVVVGGLVVDVMELAGNADVITTVVASVAPELITNAKVA